MAQKALELLDQPAALLSKDVSGMHRLIAQFPDFLLQESKDALPPPPPFPYPMLMISGMGGSGMVGDIVAEESRQSLGIYGFSVKGYEIPKVPTENTYCLCVSYSGNTEETLSVYKECRSQGISCAVISSGGKLTELARADGVPVFSVPSGYPPRAALPLLLSAAFRFLAWGGWKANLDHLREASELLQKKRHSYLPESLLAHNSAKQIALKLQGKIPIIAGAAGICYVAALRWRAQLQENSKVAAFDLCLPEANHNAIVPLAEMRKGEFPFVMVMTRDAGDSPRMTKRLDITKSLVATHLEGAVDVWSEGNSPFARLLSLIYLGDYVSLYLALLRGVDPTPVAPIDKLKRELSR